MSISSTLDADESFALSPAQERLWVLDQLDPGSPIYNIPVGLRLSGALDFAALARSMDMLARRHESLRTRFEVVDGLPRQMIAPAPALRIPQADLSALPAGARANAAERLAQTLARQPFDLAAAPLIRILLLRLHDTEHVLVVSVHHIVADGWSMGVFMRELSALYAAYSRGMPASLPDLPVQYVDYAIWQREWLAAPDALADQLSYWKQRLGGALPALDLPADHPRPPVQSLRGATYLFELPPNVTAELQALCRAEGATLFMLMLAALQTLLFRYTGEPDQRIGTPITNRPRPELEGLIGLFVNTLVLRADLSGDPSFRDLLVRVREACLEAYTRQDAPFEKLVELIQPERDLSRTPLFQVMLAQQAPLPALTLGDLRIGRVPLDSGTSKFDLTLFMEDRERTVECMWEYNRDLFEPATIARLTERFRTLLAGILRDPGQRLSRLPLLSEAERRQILEEWNAPPGDAPPEIGLADLFEAQVARTPGAVAVIDARQALTYAELNQRANRLAHYLRRRGVGPETLAAVCVGRSAELVVALLGVLKTGAAYLPLDPGYPAERLAFMLEDSQAHAIVISDLPFTISDLEALQRTIVNLGVDAAQIAREPDDDPPRRTSAEQLAYVIYTSGSTGRPKGVAATQRGAVALIGWAREIYRPDDLRRVLASTSLNFDISVYEIFLPLSVGGAVVVAENALALADLDASADVTLINSVPSAVAELARLGGIPAGARTINLAGEPLPRKLVDQLYALPGVERVYNLYGPTEDTVYSTFALLPRDDPRQPTIGHPIVGGQAYVLDAHMQPAPIGVAGELYLGGWGLARGYLGRPDLTAERFVPNPFCQGAVVWDQRSGSESRSPIPDPRLYQTGDLARYEPDGAITFLGRRDQQIKLRGFRIELGEIEAALAQHPRVEACVVAARADTPGDKRLVAYIIPSNELQVTSNEQPAADAPSSFVLRPSSLDPDSSLVTRHSSLAPELRGFLAARLPAYMLPDAFVALDALPLTPNGKIDRRALPAPKASERAASVAFVAPRTPTEARLAEIWVAVLGVERAGVEDNFFDLGGHSLLATQIIGQAREAFQVNLPLRSLFEQPTIAHLAQLIDAAPPPAPKAAAPRLRAVPRRQRAMDELLKQLEQLSDDEVAALLAQRLNKPSS